MNFNSIKIRLKNNSPKVWWIKSTIVQRIRNAEPIVTSPKSEFQVHVLVSKRDYDQLLWALYSFFKHIGQPTGLVIHDDGTLTQQQCDEVLNLFTFSRLIKRHHADELMKVKLLGLPLCTKFRKGHVTNLKVLDFWALADAKKIIYFDSDLIFLEDPKEIFQRNTGNFFLRDIWTNYCLSYERLVTLFGKEVKSHVNIGFGCVDANAFSFDLIEEILSYPEIMNATYIADQTILAILTSRNGLTLLDGKYQMLDTPSLGDRIVNHYTNVIRYKMYTEAIPFIYNKFLRH